MRVHLRKSAERPFSTVCGLQKGHLTLRTNDPAQVSCHKCFDIAKKKGLVK